MCTLLCEDDEGGLPQPMQALASWLPPDSPSYGEKKHDEPSLLTTRDTQTNNNHYCFNKKINVNMNKIVLIHITSITAFITISAPLTIAIDGC